MFYCSCGRGFIDCVLSCLICAAVAIHWRRQLVYFSTSRDRVHRIALNATSRDRDRDRPSVVGTRRRRARSPSVTDTDAADVLYQAGSRAGGEGLGLSVDWLYDRLYVADQNTVKAQIPLCRLPRDVRGKPVTSPLAEIL